MADVTITIAAGANSVVKTIPSDKLADFRAGFLRKEPVPQIPDPAWVDPEDGTQAPLIDKYSELQHFANILEYTYKMIYKAGKKRLSNDASVVDDDVIIDG
jgi:hypothetical protein